MIELGDSLKWAFASLGAVGSFYVIDVGKLKLEQFRVKADSQRLMLEAYLRATETPQPDVWERKLNVLKNFAGDDRMVRWAEKELSDIDQYAGLEALYQETLKVASQLIEPGRLAYPDRVAARERFNQLYWADLPFAGESKEVKDAMVEFLETLVAAEAPDAHPDMWRVLREHSMINLSLALRASRRARKGMPAEPPARSSAAPPTPAPPPR